MSDKAKAAPPAAAKRAERVAVVGVVAGRRASRVPGRDSARAEGRSSFGRRPLEATPRNSGANGKYHAAFMRRIAFQPRTAPTTTQRAARTGRTAPPIMVSGSATATSMAGA